MIDHNRVERQSYSTLVDPDVLLSFLSCRTQHLMVLNVMKALSMLAAAWLEVSTCWKGFEGAGEGLWLPGVLVISNPG